MAAQLSGTKGRRFDSARSLSVISILIAAGALAGFTLMAYEDIKPTLVVSFDVYDESDTRDRAERIFFRATVSNTGRRAARDVQIRINIANICQQTYRLGYIPPGHSALPYPPHCEFEIPDAPILEEHMNEAMERFEWMTVDVKYTWEISAFSITYDISETITPANYHSVDMRLH